MGIFGPHSDDAYEGSSSKSGSWWFESKSDKRFKRSGHADFLSTWGPPTEAKEALEKLEAKYGPAPDDLEWGFCKD